MYIINISNTTVTRKAPINIIKNEKIDCNNVNCFPFDDCEFCIFNNDKSYELKELTNRLNKLREDK